MKRFLTLCTLVVLCISAWGRSGDKPLRLLYWNIQNGMWSGQEDNYNAFVDWVKAQNPDICVWCEAETLYYDGTDTKRPQEERFLPQGWKQLARRYGHRYVYMGGHRDSYPQVITSRYPIEGMAQIVGQEPDSVVVHGAGWARIQVQGVQLNIVTLHTSPLAYDFRLKKAPKARQEASAAAHEGDAYRKMELAYICRHTVLPHYGENNRYWMMMGDFNAVSRLDNGHYGFPADAPCFQTHNYVLDETPYVDVVHQMHPMNFEASAQSRQRIDFVYATEPLFEKVQEARIVQDRYTSPVRSQEVHNFFRPSDHMPILVDFSL